MTATLVVHIVAGGLGLIAGYVALYATKGGSLHRRSGSVFVYAMLTMSLAGALISAARGIAMAVNIPASVLTAYLVLTSIITLKPEGTTPRWLDRLLMTIAFVLGFTCIALAFSAGPFAFPLIMFGSVATIGAFGDLKVMRIGKLQGAPRLRRHLWRITYALFIAAMSFFIGQAKVIPEPIRIRPLLALPVLAVLFTLFYWLWRTRRTRARRPLVTGGLEHAQAASSIR
jgi:uncharacterized membrane protein